MTLTTATSATTSTSFEPLLTSQGAAGAKSGATKIAGKVLIDILAAPGAASIDAVQMGVLFGLVRAGMSEGVSSFPRARAEKMAHLHTRSLRETAMAALEMLDAAELIVLSADFIAIPALERAVLEQTAERERRSRGWERRREISAAPEATEPAVKPTMPKKAKVKNASRQQQEPQEPVSPAAARATQPESPVEPAAPSPVVSDDDLMGAASLSAEAFGAEGDVMAPLADGFEVSPAHDQAEDFTLDDDAGNVTFDLDDEGAGSEVILLEVDTNVPGDDEPLVEIIAKGGTLVRVTRGYINWLQELSPKVNALEQTKLAAAWCLANKAKRKTVNGMNKFLLSWMVRHAKDLDSRARKGGASAFGTGSAAAVASPVNGADDGLDELIALADGDAQTFGDAHAGALQ